MFRAEGNLSESNSPPKDKFRGFIRSSAENARGSNPPEVRIPRKVSSTRGAFSSTELILGCVVDFIVDLVSSVGWE